MTTCLTTQVCTGLKTSSIKYNGSHRTIPRHDKNSNRMIKIALHLAAICCGKIQICLVFVNGVYVYVINNLVNCQKNNYLKKITPTTV